MDFITDEILSGELIPVLLGLSPEANQTAHRLYKKYGVISHVFCHRVAFPFRLNLCMKYHAIGKTLDERLLLDALLDFSHQTENQDVILYLIPCTQALTNLVWEHREQLERYFVIADRPEMQRVWFDEALPFIEKGGRA